jgi:hypothetical protein
MPEAASFGQQIAGSPTARALIAFESDAGKASAFTDLDDLLGHLMVRALIGERIASVQRDRRADAVSIDGLDQAREHMLTEWFLLANQRARGAWFLPEQASLKVGLLSLPATFAAQPRFASGLVRDERARVDLTQSAPGIFIWSVLEPFFQQLYTPLELRGYLVGTKSREEQLASWTSVDELVSALEMDLSDELAVMRYGGGWGRLRSTEQLEAKQRLLAALAGRAAPGLASLYRAHRVRPLIARYYEKAKDGRALRKQVLTRALERTLSGFFGGDWLSFLAYLGEQPHPHEEIAVAIPETKLFVGGTKTAVAIAAEKGLPAAEVKRMLASYWDTGGEQSANASSPVDERVQALSTYWRVVDEIHARQASGMRSLWGLVEGVGGIHIGWEGPEWYHPRLYRELLPADLIENIERLWGSIMLPRWPDRIVSEISPHALMAQTFGAALNFWHECALTVWFLAEGPASRTDMAGLSRYHQDAIAEMQRLGCPIDPALFAELTEAEVQLGPSQPIKDESSTVEVAPGISTEISTSSGSRRPGFEGLRDVVTRHRRAWAQQYLDSYLRARWEMELREAARLHAQAIAERGKPPTAKQFARHAAMPTNHWLGGDIAALYAAVGEKSPVHPRRVTLMPRDRRGFALFLFRQLGGRPFEPQPPLVRREELLARAEEQDRQAKLGWLAAESLRLVQLEEAIGRPPQFKEFGAPSFEYRSAVLADDSLEAWQHYVTTVCGALAKYRTVSAGGSDVAAPPPPPHTGPPSVIETTAPTDVAPTHQNLDSRSWFARFRHR